MNHSMVKFVCRSRVWIWNNNIFQLKLWTSLGTVFVEIYSKEKNWWRSRPIWVTSWKEFLISLKKWRFENFQRVKASTFKMPMDGLINCSRLCCQWRKRSLWFICYFRTKFFPYGLSKTGKYTTWSSDSFYLVRWLLQFKGTWHHLQSEQSIINFKNTNNQNK